MMRQASDRKETNGNPFNRCRSPLNRDSDEHSMKTLTRTLAALASCTITILALVVSPLAQADDSKPMKPMKGAEHLLMLHALETTDQVNALKDNDSIAFVCSKCKTVWVTTVRKGAKGAEVLAAGGQPVQLVGTHPCTACKSTITITGQRLDKKEVLKHSCGMCGDQSAFCCAMKADGGGHDKHH